MEPVGEQGPHILGALRIAIVKHAHTPTGGAEDALADYLQPRVSVLAKLAHPFPNARAVPAESVWTEWRKGKVVAERTGWRGRGPDVFYYLRDVLETLRRFCRRGSEWDVYVGVDNLNASVGVLLRALGRVKSVVFYVIDYVPQRFSNPVLNWAYHALDRFAARRADCVWNLNEAMAGARAAAGLPEAKCAQQLVVPMGAEPVAKPPPENVRPTVVYLGHLIAVQGVHLLLDAWPAVCAAVPNATLRIVGTGDEVEALRKQAQRLGVSESIEWLGFVPDEMLYEALGSCWVAVAPYPEVEQGYKQYADPAKLRQYCAAGLPAVVTTVPQAATAFENAGVAVRVPPTSEALAEAIGALLQDQERRARMGKAALGLAQSYAWDAIFSAAWQHSLPSLEHRWARR